MNCEKCEEKSELLTIKEFTGEDPHTYDFSIDGKVFKVCPSCFTVDTIGLRGTRQLLQHIKDNINQYSRRDKIKVLQVLCDKQKLPWDEKKMTVSKIMKLLKNRTDRSCLDIISNYYNISVHKVDVLFYNIKLYRIMVQQKK